MITPKNPITAAKLAESMNRENNQNSTYCEACGCRITAGRCQHGVTPPKAIRPTMTQTRAESFTERRKADRIEMAAHVAELAKHHGATVEIVNPIHKPEDIHVNILAAHGLALTVEFQQHSCQPDIHVLSWHFATKGETKLSNIFGQSRNTCHFRKATDVAYGFVELCQCASHGLAMAQDGSAFAS